VSKYNKQGCYHYKLFATEGDPYRLHVLDVIEKVREHLGKPDGQPILDVGCGEGLVIDQLHKLGYDATGIEIDEDAIRLGREKGNGIARMTIQDIPADESESPFYDAILMLDVLEHVDDFPGTIQVAQDLADLIFIAVPDREDPGAQRQLIQLDVLLMFEPNWAPNWEVIHQSTRHARHFMVFRLRGC